LLQLRVWSCWSLKFATDDRPHAPSQSGAPALGQDVCQCPRASWMLCFSLVVRGQLPLVCRSNCSELNGEVKYASTKGNRRKGHRAFSHCLECLFWPSGPDNHMCNASRRTTNTTQRPVFKLRLVEASRHVVSGSPLFQRSGWFPRTRGGVALASEAFNHCCTGDVSRVNRRASFLRKCGSGRHSAKTWHSTHSAKLP
jgi:hypothetical protein